MSYLNCEEFRWILKAFDNNSITWATWVAQVNAWMRKYNVDHVRAMLVLQQYKLDCCVVMYNGRLQWCRGTADKCVTSTSVAWTDFGVNLKDKEVVRTTFMQLMAYDDKYELC